MPLVAHYLCPLAHGSALLPCPFHMYIISRIGYVIQDVVGGKSRATCEADDSTMRRWLSIDG